MVRQCTCRASAAVGRSAIGIVSPATKDLHSQNLRHEGTCRLFEAGFAIEQVALVTGHKKWAMLRCYTDQKPESLHMLPASRAA